MEIKTSAFVTSFASIEKYIEYEQSSLIPEICIVGRSNVGKSTFINTLTRRNKLAKTSSTPGRTRLINVFDINNNQFRLVDLPGYGYAQTSKSEKEEWGKLIEDYLQSSQRLIHTLVLVDVRHTAQKTDEQMLGYLYYYRMPFTVIATKSDKLSKAEISRNVTSLSSSLKLGRDDIIAVSQTGYNINRVLERLDEILQLQQ